ncbi:methyltransferase domain-containing protein [Brevibacillus sp. SYP-B805]|uniref:class I SAM-dependent methyltransferase n=1 Tax=Brevibacillus sp. SYP-B805 TaxID=1578199 RepID=UPI0013EB0114|nr:class I SAM-dependent methyltransferase [Brevibacillus sp. SYP-B805]NGQ94693.1 methyltransferase domain-containing protein [Brevibacillus sp. SYP-B805]
MSKNRWDATLYDTKLSFVSELGKSMISLLDPQKGERILDIGCGTGDLAAQIALSGAIPTGIDLSADMIDRARQKYPALRFEVADAQTYRTDERYDAVFSNAALHWMKQPASVIQSVWLALRPGGRFVAEFGGKSNIGSILDAIAQVLTQRGIDAEERNPWYFPSVGEYSVLLEQQGFRVTYAAHFDRPTPLGDDEHGLTHWLDTFAKDFFHDFSPAEKAHAYQEIADILRPRLYSDNGWTADYSRIRILAVKPAEVK